MDQRILLRRYVNECASKLMKVNVNMVIAMVMVIPISITIILLVIHNLFLNCFLSAVRVTLIVVQFQSFRIFCQCCDLFSYRSNLSHQKIKTF